jgi:hypothetical protein
MKMTDTIPFNKELYHKKYGKCYPFGRSGNSGKEGYWYCVVEKMNDKGWGCMEVNPEELSEKE